MAFSVNGSVGALALAQALVGSGVTISNVTYTGNAAQGGTFAGGLAAGGTDTSGNAGIGFESGIVLSTGKATDLVNGPIDFYGWGTSTDYSGAGDTVLTGTTGAPTHDAAVLQFDFNPGTADKIYFNFVFGTDEYPSSPNFNDGFAILVNGTNVALVPGDNSAVELSDFARAVDKKYYKESAAVAAKGGNPDGFTTQQIGGTMTSMSVPLQAVATVLPNQVNHIKFAIADSGDGLVDSFVFIQSASLSTTAVPLSLAASLANDTGTSSSDHLTSDLHIHVTANLSGPVTLSESGVTIGSGTITAGGAVDIAPGTLSQGTHTITVSETDTQGIATTTTVNLIYDTVAPSLTATESVGGLTRQTSDVLSGSVSDANGVASVQIKDGASILGTATVTGNTWTYTATGLSEGVHSFTATATDKAGNTAAAVSTGTSVTVDLTPATLTASEAVSGVTSQKSDLLSGSVSDLNGVNHVEVFDGAADLGAATLSGTGWSLTASALAEGTHSFTAIATDNAGNSTAAVSTGAAVIVDTTAPVVTITSVPLVTKTAAQTLTGTVTDLHPGSTVAIFDNGAATPLATATIGAGGAWSASVTLLTGANNLVAVATDLAGNTGSSAAVTDVLGVPPIVTLAAAPMADNVIKATLGTAVTGTLADAISVTLTSDADFATGSHVDLVGGTLIYTPGLITAATVGSDTITYTVTDTVTGAVTTETQTVTLGNGPAPSIALAAAPAADNLTHATLGTATAGLGTDALSVTLTSDAGFATGSSVALVGSSLVYTPGLIATTQTGPDTIAYDVTDTVTGAVTHQTQTVTLGAGPTPVVTVTSAALLTATASQPIAGTVTGFVTGSTVSIFDNGAATALATASVAADGSWQTNVTLAEGGNSLVAQVTSPYIQTANSTAIVDTVDTTAPVVTITSAPLSTNHASQTITGTVTDLHQGSTVTLFDNGTQIGTATVAPDGTWSTTVTLPNQGANSLVAKDTDLAGNTGASAAVVDSLYTTAPTLTVTESVSGLTRLTSDTVSGTVSSPAGVATVQIKDGATVLGNASITGSNWTYTATGLADGPHNFTATATDGVGNATAAQSAGATVTVDATPPTITFGTEVSQAAGTPGLSSNLYSSQGYFSDNPSFFATRTPTTVATVTSISNGSVPNVTSYRFDGYFKPNATGTYSLRLASDDSSVMYIGTPGQTLADLESHIQAGTGLTSYKAPVVNDSGQHGTNTVTATASVTAGSTYPVLILFGNNGGPGNIVFTYANPTAPGSFTGDLSHEFFATSPITAPDPLFARAGNVVSENFTVAPSTYGAAAVVDSVTIDGHSATVTPGAGNTYTATYTVQAGDQNGLAAVTVTAHDAAGNSTTGTTSGTVTIDTVPPVLTATETVSGLTKLTSDLLSGTVSDVNPGTSVQITDGGAALGSTTIAADGSWSYNATGLADGVHSFAATTTDKAGNSATTSAGASVTVDTAPASLTVTESVSGNTNRTSDVISGSVSDLNGVRGVEVFDGATDLGAATVTGTSWSFTASGLAEGSHSFTALATDKAGNTTAALSAGAPTIVDTTAPAVAITSPGLLTKTATQTIAGTVSDLHAGSTVSIFDNGASTAIATATIGAGGAWSTSVTLSGDGTHSLVARNTDLAGNTGSSAAVIDVLDTAAPAVAITSAGGFTNNASQILAGTATDLHAGSTVSIFDNGAATAIGTATIGAGGAWSTTVSLAGDGIHSLVAKSTDLALNTGSSAAVVDVLDTVAPVVTITSAPVVSAQAAQTVSGTVSDLRAGSTVSIYDNGANAPLATATVGAGGTWSASVTLPSTGINSLVAKDTDLAGNTGSSAPVIDVLGPPPVVTLAAAPSADNATTATLGTAVTAYLADPLSVALTADADFATGSHIDLVGTQLIYTPGLITPAQSGVDTISYTVTDTFTGAVTTKTQTVTLSNGPAPVVSLATAPSADNATTATLGTALAGLGGHALSVTLTSDADFTSGSTVSLSSGKLIYTPGLVTSAKAGADTISYDVTDTVTGAVTHETQTVTLGNGPAPAVTLATAPAADNAHTALLGTASPGIAGDVLSVTLTSDAGFATGSSLSLVGNQLVYTPGIVTAAKIGPDAISYTVTDLRTGAVTSETQSVTLANGPAPVITPASAPTADRLDPAILGTAVAGVNNDPLKVTLISDSIFVTGSSIALAGGVLTYTPGLVTIGNIGADTLGYTVTDTVTGATTYQTQTLSLTLLDVKSNNTIYLTGQDNTVTGLQHRALSSGNQGAEITDPTPWIAGGTITGTPDTETIRVRGYHNTIIADGGNDTIYAGTSNEHVIVSDFNGDNIVKGFVDTTSVVLGDGSNTIDIGGYGNDVRLGDGNNSIFAGVAAIKVKVGNGDNVISTTGYGDIITAGTGHNSIDAGLGYASVTLAGGTGTVTAGGYYDTFNIAGGTTSLGGFAGFATINLGAGFGTADSIDLRDTASDSFTFKNGQMLVTQADGELVATINTPNGQVVSALDDGAGGHRIVLGLISPPAQAVITETTWGVTLDLAPATKTVHLAGYGNTVTGGNGNHLIDGDAGGLRLTLADGNNVVSASGNGDIIHLGNGNNVVAGNLGSSEIHTGAGNQTITATGYSNDIRTGAGNSTIKAGAGFSKVDAGSGINTIAVDGSQNTVITHDGDSTVQLSGWTNLIQAGAGHTLVGGGYFNTYEVTALGHAGGVEVSDFSTQYGDVLNLHDVLGINAIVSVADGTHGDLLVSVTNGTTTYVAADLHGMAGTSLATLLTNHSITV